LAAAKKQGYCSYVMTRIPQTFALCARPSVVGMACASQEVPGSLAARHIVTSFRLPTMLTHWIRHAKRVWCTLLLCLPAGLCGCSLIGAALPYAGIKLYFACLPEHTRIDTPSGPQSIESLQPGDVVIGFNGKPVRVLQKHSYLEDPATVFLRISFADGATVDLCQMHRIAGVRAREIRKGQTVAGRQVTRIESRLGETRSYDLLTEDSGYQIAGVSVNSMIEEMNTAAVSGVLPKR
jgi:hypothetical protein